MRTPVSTLAVVLALTACSSSAIQNGSTGEVGTPPAQNCTPLETRAANAPDQTPAFAGQTRTCGVKSNTPLEVTVVARGLDHPWAVEPLPGGDLLVTEKPGRLRIISASGTIGEPITGLPAVDARGQGGLLDVALSPGFATDRTIFWSYSEPRDGGNGTAVARGVLSADRRSLSDVRVILRVLPTYNGTMHYGSRLAFAPDGKLFITTGERSNTEMRAYAQRLDSHLGKVLRINADGSVPSDNPFVNTSGAQGQVYTLGHRNIQAASVDAQGRLWIIEHGTRGGDELNLIEKGGNYGWPQQAYGEEYSGNPIPGAQTAREGMKQPVYYWDPVIAPSGAQWYSANAFPAWRGNLFVGALKEKRLVRLVITNDRVTQEEHLLTDRGQRIRDVRQGPDGYLYIVTDETDGQLWRVAPGR
ncbi:MAG TPA: PQQ-dependent sugar dehydrogenase [Gemmatimonadaceae bacterium]|nr:PQQ-dependent sugar dehydrogenase [Gemmatimonadaceae bacterium]